MGTETRSRGTTIGGGLALLLVAAVCLSLPIIAAGLSSSGRLVVLIAPGSEPQAMMDVIARAGGRFLGSSRVPWIAVAIGEKDGFAQRLRTAGALMTFDGAFFQVCENSKANPLNVGSVQ